MVRFICYLQEDSSRMSNDKEATNMKFKEFNHWSFDIELTFDISALVLLNHRRC